MEVTLASFKKRFTYDPAKDLLGKGGFGEVYKAFDNEDQKYVALKIYSGAAGDKYNLMTEVKRFKKFRHPNIIEHIEAYEVNTGATDIHGQPLSYQVGILEYADGGTLADLMKKGKIDYRTLEPIAQDIIDGLSYLHTNGVIHRDLKPTNILLSQGADRLHAKIADFGISKIGDVTSVSTKLVGTIEYMAPECFKGDTPVTASSDMWSLGVILLEALSGEHPFGKTSTGNTNEQVIYNILHKDLNPFIQLLVPPFRDIISRCLIREPNLRPQSASDINITMKSDGSFSEKTQVISGKIERQIDKQNQQRGKLLKYLVDFDLQINGWKKIFARETLIAILLPIIINPLLWILLFLPICYLLDLDHIRNDYNFSELYTKVLPLIMFKNDKYKFPMFVSFLIVFPARYIVSFLLWIISTLGITLPILSVKLKKTIWTSLIVFIIIIAGGISYSEYKKGIIKKQQEIVDKRVDSIARAEVIVNEKVAEFERKQRAIQKAITCTEQQALGDFKLYMKFNYPDWQIIGNPQVLEHADCTYRVQFTTLDPAYHGDWMFKEVIIGEISYSDDYQRYYFRTIRGWLH
jgi:serine/threonine protein kinase